MTQLHHKSVAKIGFFKLITAFTADDLAFCCFLRSGNAVKRRTCDNLLYMRKCCRKFEVYLKLFAIFVEV